jgi:hypothetical protein
MIVSTTAEFVVMAAGVHHAYMVKMQYRLMVVTMMKRFGLIAVQDRIPLPGSRSLRNEELFVSDMVLLKNHVMTVQ